MPGQIGESHIWPFLKSQSDLFYSIYSGNIWCANGSFESTNSENTDQTALTASLIWDYNILPFQHYHLATL